MTTKITDANIDSDKQDNNAFNISLLGFKMAVNEGLTVFNLVDGVVDEFNDESGTDEAEGSNDVYCATSDFYQNITVTPACVSAGFSTSAITEPDTSTTGTNPTEPTNNLPQGSGTFGQFTVPSGMTTVSIKMWGAGGGGSVYTPDPSNQWGEGGGGGFASGCLAVTPGQTFTVVVGEGGVGQPNIDTGGGYNILGGGGNLGPTPSPDPEAMHSQGGGMSAVMNGCVPTTAAAAGQVSATAPQAFIVAGAGGGTSYAVPNAESDGGAGGGLIGDAGGQTTEQTSAAGTGSRAGGGGDQEQGGSAGSGPGGPAQSGSLFKGGDSLSCSPLSAYAGSGGGGYYGGGGASYASCHGGGGGGGSSYYGHPQVSSGSTEEGAEAVGGGTADPAYSPISPDPGPNTTMNNGVSVGDISAPLRVPSAPQNGFKGGDGYVLMTGSYCVPSPGASTTIVSTAFTSTSVATNARVVVFEEDVDTPTLNTDVIASVSRDGGTTFTNATLSDSGYVTGSSGQRILTGQADISGQPSGQSMRWKLALANNTVKIHGVSLQWS